jgi:hypothetical protein
MAYYHSSHVLVSEPLKLFLNKRFDTSTAVYMLINYLLGNLNSSTTNTLNKTVFDKIHSVTESDDGYLVFNGNQKIKLGKLIVKVADELEIDTKTKDDAKEIEKYVNRYKSWYKAISKLHFETLKGDSILRGYNPKFHVDNGGMLRGSCMNKKWNCLELYTKNPEKVELLVLVDGNNNIYGRSFLWKLDNVPYIFMDRVYGAENYITDMFTDYAKKHGMIYREQEQLNKYVMAQPR